MQHEGGCNVENVGLFKSDRIAVLIALVLASLPTTSVVAKEQPGAGGQVESIGHQLYPAEFHS
jgi:hypothetical protein